MIQELERRSQKHPLASMLRGALTSLQDETNPESLIHAAHSLRELMDKFEQSMSADMPPETKPDATGEFFKLAADLEQQWQTAKKSSSCYLSERGWSGELDQPLALYLTQMEQFFVSKRKDKQMRDNRKIAVLVGMDPEHGALEPKQQVLVIKFWVKLFRFFKEASHNRNTKRQTIEEHLQLLEAFLYRRIIPTEAQKKKAIQALIRKAESP